MAFEKYKTDEIEFIIAHLPDLQRELEKRKNKEFVGCFFKEGDTLYCTNHDGDKFFIKVKEISVPYNNVTYDEIVIRNEGYFDNFEDEWDDYNLDWSEYKKLDDTSIFDKLNNAIKKYNDGVKNLENATFDNLKCLTENL